MRDAQSNFDQVISFSGEKIGSADVTNALGFAGVEILTRTMNAIAGREPKQMLEVVDDIIARGHDLRNFCRDVLGLFRDLLVYKVAPEEKQLFEGAVFTEAELKTLADSFTANDLLRFFNSLCETEASLREAPHPRYVLEIGLVKLIEMRSVATIESILERLGSLGIDLPGQRPSVGSAASASASPTLEKKTLNADPVPALEHYEPEPPDAEPEPDVEEPSEIVMPAEPFSPVVYEPAVLRLPVLTSEDLNHFDEPKLDDAYEEKLSLTGDDLRFIKGASSLVAPFVPAVGKKSASMPAAGNGSAAAAVPAFDVEALKNEILPEIKDVEIPELGEEPSDDELLEYAKAHTGVRTAVRVFRAKIIEVKRVR